MAIRNLRVQIFLNFAVLLLIAMMLVNFVLLIVGQNSLIQAEIARADLVASAIHNFLKPNHIGTEPTEEIGSAFLDRFCRSAGVKAVLILDRANRRRYAYTDGDSGLVGQMEDWVRSAAGEGLRRVHYNGTTRGVFWRQKASVVLAAPLAFRGEEGAGIGVMMHLGNVYASLRRTQHIVLIYTIVNMVILAFFGLYRMNLLAVKPIRRLVARAESLRESDDDVFLIDREDSAFSQLSKSLNRMLLRVADTREKLKSSVQSLETANRKLEETQKEMVRAEKLASVGRLSAGIAHEIGNPIGIIRGYLDLLKDPSTPETDRLEFIGRTQTEIDRISSIIRQLLELSRPVLRHNEKVSVHEILRDIGDVCRYQPMFSELHLDMELSAPVDVVYADAGLLRQVFLNLMINSADALNEFRSNGDGRISIRTSWAPATGEHRCREGRFRVAFSDNGPGVPEPHLLDIFDPFYSTKAPGKGTGLGLSVSYMLIQSLGGGIQAENRANGGLSMTIDLPAAQGPEK